MKARRRPVWALTVAAITAYAWWTTALRPFTWSALVAVETAGMTAMAFGSSRRRAAVPARPRHLPAGAAVWATLAALLAVWELAAYIRVPRSDHPTLSSILDGALDAQPLRSLAFLVWLAGAYELARR